MDNTSYAISATDVEKARERINVVRTPVLSFLELNERTGGREVFFKCELMQRSGSFKFRGASNAIALLNDVTGTSGVTTHSSGNHAAALALAAKIRGIPATIVMPSNAPTTKRNAVKSYGAKIISCEPTQAAREAAAKNVVDETGAEFIHPSEDPRVIAGQGTMALELIEQVKEIDGGSLDAIIVPVGGGGMISGIAIALKASNPHIRVIGAEPFAANDAFRSKQTGEWQGHLNGVTPKTIADGLKTTLGPNTFPIVRDLVDEIICVTEPQIASALKLVYETMKLAIEPSAAVGVAALLSEELSFISRPNIKRVGVILCGGNLDLVELPLLLGEKNEI